MNREAQIAEGIVAYRLHTAAPHDLKVGDILYSSWGYDQTNIDFYQVTAVGVHSVKIREIEQKVVGGSTGSDLVTAEPGKFKGPEMFS